jgi:tetratricopeptide (TPR) repeat protein
VQDAGRLNSKDRNALTETISALTEANPDTRPINQAAALAHLDKSATLDPTSWETRYHLAYQLAELRQVSPALDHARKAVELAGPRASREAWHLLGLLVAAQKDMRKAMQVIETALEEDEYGEGDEDMDDGIPSSRGLAAANGSSDGLIRRLDDRLARLPPPVGSVPSSTVDSTPAVHSPGAAATQTMTRSPTSNFEFFQDQTARLVSGVQLRMTKNVIIEVLEGPEAALIDQQSLLAYFSAAYARIDDIGEWRW